MKKILAITLLSVITLCCAFAFTACGSDGKLAMDKRYIHANDVGSDASEQRSYVFHSNGTGEYTYHEHYTIHFKYTYVDSDKSAVVCFYDSITRLEGDDGSTHTGWRSLVTVSKNVLTTTGTYGFIYWINENYLKTIPNYHS